MSDILNVASRHGTNPSTPLSPQFFGQTKPHENINEFFERGIRQHTQNIQHVKISHNGQYVGTYSEADGILSIWNVVSGQSSILDTWEISSRPEKAHFAFTHYQTQTSRISLSVSNDGHIALSFFVLSQDDDDFTTQPFKLKDENYEVQCLVLRANQNRAIQNDDFVNIIGVASFLPNNDLVIYDNNSLSYYSIHEDHAKLMHR